MTKWKQATFVTKFGPVPIQSTVRCCFGGVSSKTHRKIDTSSSKIEIQWLSVLIIWSLFLQVRPFERPFNTYIIIYKSYIYNHIIFTVIQVHTICICIPFYTIWYHVPKKELLWIGQEATWAGAWSWAFGGTCPRKQRRNLGSPFWGVDLLPEEGGLGDFRLFFYMFYTCLPCLSRSSICVSEASLFALPCFFSGEPRHWQCLLRQCLPAGQDIEASKTLPIENLLNRLPIAPGRTWSCFRDLTGTELRCASGIHPVQSAKRLLHV